MPTRNFLFDLQHNGFRENSKFLQQLETYQSLTVTIPWPLNPKKSRFLLLGTPKSMVYSRHYSVEDLQQRIERRSLTTSKSSRRSLEKFKYQKLLELFWIVQKNNPPIVTSWNTTVNGQEWRPLWTYALRKTK